MKQTPAQTLGRKGERWFQGALPSTWLFQRPTEDFGIDGTVAIGTPDAVTALEFGVQIKSSRRWKQEAGSIHVSGIPTHTFAYWTARLVPTLFVIYDETQDVGFYAWIPESLEDPLAVLQSKKRSVTLRVSTNSILDKDAWENIEEWVRRDHRRLTEAVSTSSIAAALLTTIHEMSSSLRLLQVVEFAQPKGDDDKMALNLSDLVAHKTVYIALRTLATKFPSGEPVRIQLEQAAAAYAAEVETFIAHATQSFEQALQSDAPMLHWANPELMDAYRPKMLFLIADYLCKLSSLLRSSTSSYS